MDKQIYLNWRDGSRCISNHPFAKDGWHRQTHMLGIGAYYRQKGLRLVWDTSKRELVIDINR